MVGYVMKRKGRHPINALTALKVKRESNQGFYADGNGLYLKVDKNGAKRWVQRIVINSKRRDIGLGSALLLSLADARMVALNNRKIVLSGGDPLEEKKKKQGIPTFKEASYVVYEIYKPTWKNKKHGQQWINTLENYVFKIIGDKKIGKINSADMLSVLTPIWTEKPETANRVRQRIGVVLKWAIGSGYRWDNPAMSILEVLPKRDKAGVNHHKALPYQEVSSAIETIQNSRAMQVTKLAFEFLILTNVRSGVARGALWSEIKGDKWEIPKERMKAKKAHRVPLSKRCLEILSIMKDQKNSSKLVFPNKGKPLSDVAFSKLLRDLKINCVPHGFRTSFRMWSSEKTNYPNQLCEFAMAHVVGDAAERAYQRSDLFEKRRELMESWSRYAINKKADVIPLQRRA